KCVVDYSVLILDATGQNVVRFQMPRKEFTFSLLYSTHTVYVTSCQEAEESHAVSFFPVTASESVWRREE
ncbi:hypothetical protein BaRGS_00019684, partial [Batillaria attramentaria]